VSDLNCYSFTGRLGADAETKHTAGGTVVWSARVAVGYGYGDKKGTNWLTVKAFGKRAEGLGKLDLAKGAQIGASGEMHVREYDKRDGTKGTDVEVIVNEVALLGSKPEGQRAPRQEATSAPKREAAPATAAEFGKDFADDDIPF
jgi:single-strand DNA-binding protein